MQSYGTNHKSGEEESVGASPRLAPLTNWGDAIGLKLVASSYYASFEGQGGVTLLHDSLVCDAAWRTHCFEVCCGNMNDPVGVQPLLSVMFGRKWWVYDASN